MNRIYLDHSATTPLDPEVLKKMTPYFTDIFGNASSMHGFGQEGAYAVDKARRKIAGLIGAKPNEIYFTSGGTEADNWAIKGMALKMRGKCNKIITSAIEHAAIMESCHQVQKELGYEIVYLPVGKRGIVDPEDLKKTIDDKTALVSIMTANNEIGTIQPIRDLAAIAREKGVFFHTDAVQAMGSIPMNVNDLGVDMMSFSGHKFYGPKGIGVLYIRGGVKPERFMTGGHQERTMRGGTTNVPSVVGIAEALDIAVRDLDKNYAYIKSLRDRFVSRVKTEIPYVFYNGDENERLPQNANFSFEYIEGESILMSLDLAGIATSSGSACSSGSLEPSHVLLATGLPIEIAHGSIRFSFGKHNTMEEVDYTVDELKKIVNKLRAMSPLFNEIKGANANV